MPGFLQSLAVLSAHGLVGQFDAPPPTVTLLPFSPFKVVLLLGWVYASLYLVKRVEDSPLVPNKYRSIIHVVTLFLGPLVFLVLLLMEGQQSTQQGTYFTRLLQRVKDIGSRIGRRRTRVREVEAKLRLFDSLGAELSEIYGHGTRKGDDKRVLNLTAQIIDDALKQRASDILIDPKDQIMYAIRLRVDGTLRTVQEVTSETCKAIINSVKAVSSMDIAERRRPQDGAFTAKRGDISFSFRVASAGALNGEKMSIRVLNQNADRFTLMDAGIPERQRTIINDAVAKPSGMVLVCGPTGSGKTTTLYSMLNLIDRHTHNVITVEDPIEAHLPEASQLEINAKADITFAKALRSILRQDPDVICVGEIRDEETAEIALRAAQTGHLVLATIHCDSNAGALVRLLDLGVSPMLMSSGLTLLVTQRLMRKLCPDCKKPAKLSPALVQEFKQKRIDTANIFDPGGCEKCGKTGYYGRTAICDLLAITEDLRTEIAQNAQISDKLRNDGEKKGRTNLKSEAIARVIAGLTSFEELKRVVG
jgi:type II secretory ATPase GspE/PulE/Tfp pilus assembly ATPase PilB-like protein